MTHPIQYLSPWFRALATNLDLHVYYAHQQTPAGQSRAGFGVGFEWDTPLLEGYPSTWLQNVAQRPGVDRFAGCDTPEIAEIIRHGNFDAFVVFGWNHKSSWQAILGCRTAGVPVLLRGDSQLQTSRSLLKRAIKYLPYRSVLPRVEGHLTVGTRNEAYLRHYGVPQHKLFRVPHCVDTDYFAARARTAVAEGKRALFREQLNIAQSAFVFLFVGKLIPKKRPFDVIAAMERLGSHAPDCHAVFVGDGPLRQQLEQSAAGHARIHFVGFQNQSHLPGWYATADALLLPSDAGETWGLVVNEAAACGRPAVVSEAAGCAPDVIDGRYTGAMHRMGDVSDMAAAMERVIRVWTTERTEASRALESTVDRFSIDRATTLFLDALATVCGHRSHG